MEPEFRAARGPLSNSSPYQVPNRSSLPTSFPESKEEAEIFPCLTVSSTLYSTQEFEYLEAVGPLPAPLPARPSPGTRPATWGLSSLPPSLRRTLALGPSHPDRLWSARGPRAAEGATEYEHSAGRRGTQRLLAAASTRTRRGVAHRSLPEASAGPPASAGSRAPQGSPPAQTPPARPRVTPRGPGRADAGLGPAARSLGATGPPAPRRPRRLVPGVPGLGTCSLPAPSPLPSAATHLPGRTSLLGPGRARPHRPPSPAGSTRTAPGRRPH